MGLKYMFDIIGDVHSCCYEMNLLFEKLGYTWDKYNNTYKPPENRKAVFVGDLIDRGPSPISTLNIIMKMVELDYALVVLGNHDDKLKRFCRGNRVILNNGLDKTVLAIEKSGLDKGKLYKFLNSTPMYLSPDDDKLIVVHGAWRNSLKDMDPFHKKCRSWCLYAPTTGKKLPNGLPDRIDWAIDRKEKEPIIVYGHQPYRNPRVLNGTYGIDTGCVFGGFLSALRYPEMEFVQIKSYRIYDTSKPDIRI